jgi:uncharacterized membrane protein YgdD (TMEM256/DUF423 family)
MYTKLKPNVKCFFVLYLVDIYFESVINFSYSKALLRGNQIMIKFWLISGAVFAAFAVMLGAFGAHALKSVLSDYSRDIYQTAVQYQMFHALALLAVGIMQQQWPGLSLHISGWCFFSGIILFSGSLYLLVTIPLKILAPVTLIGGVLFIAGWIWLIYQVIKLKL